MSFLTPHRLTALSSLDLSCYCLGTFFILFLNHWHFFPSFQSKLPTPPFPLHVWSLV